MFNKEEARIVRKEFWTSFSDYTNYYAKHVGEPIAWVLYKTGVKGLELKFDVDIKVVRVALEMNAKNENRRFDIFVELDNYKTILENNFGQELIWDDEFVLPEGKVVARVYVEWEGIKYHNRDNWPKIFKFMAENMYVLQNNFLDIQDIMIEKFGK
ncbi:MAG: DUF4268 domain-containing protein [Salinivirgaceae bacterium]|jgi:hypothetical protein|nr:DUF4268 domain-containing protein [Salinivirgaceae bacterium]